MLLDPWFLLDYIFGIFSWIVRSREEMRDRKSKIHGLGVHSAPPSLEGGWVTKIKGGLSTTPYTALYDDKGWCCTSPHEGIGNWRNQEEKVVVDK